MHGYTLVELLTTLAIAATLIGIGVPGFANLVRDYRASSAINSLIGQVQYARSSAVNFGVTVTMCPSTTSDSSPSLICGPRNTWTQGSMVFIDRNGDGHFNGTDRLLRYFPPLATPATVTWRSFRNRASLSILKSGLTNSQNGSFRYCPANRDARFARQAIINRQARIRHARDRDNDGIREAPNGTPISC